MIKVFQLTNISNRLVMNTKSTTQQGHFIMYHVLFILKTRIYIHLLYICFF